MARRGRREHAPVSGLPPPAFGMLNSCFGCWFFRSVIRDGGGASGLQVGDLTAFSGYVMSDVIESGGCCTEGQSPEEKVRNRSHPRLRGAGMSSLAGAPQLVQFIERHERNGYDLCIAFSLCQGSSIGPYRFRILHKCLLYRLHLCEGRQPVASISNTCLLGASGSQFLSRARMGA